MSTAGIYIAYIDGMLGEVAADTGDLDTDTIEGHLIDDTDYTANFGSDQFLDPAIAAAARVSSTDLATATITAGVIDAADTTFTAVSGDGIDSVALNINNGGAETADPLLILLDNGGATTPNSNDIICQWDSGGNKIFKIG